MVKMDYVWDRTTEFLGENLASVLPLAAVGIFVPTAIMNAITPLWAVAGQDLKLVLTCTVIALAVVLLWGSLAITALAIDPAARSLASRAAARRLLPLIGVYLVLMVAFVALAMPMGVLAAVSGMDMVAIQTGQMRLASQAGGWALILYALAFLIALLVFWARIMPLGAVVLAERRGAGAIARAWRLTRGMTWRLIGVAILYSVVSQVAVLAARTVFGTVLRLFGGGTAPVTIGSVITAIVVAAVSAGFSTVAAVFAAKLYVAILRTLPPAPAASADTGAAGR